MSYFALTEKRHLVFIRSLLTSVVYKTNHVVRKCENSTDNLFHAQKKAKRFSVKWLTAGFEANLKVGPDVFKTRLNNCIKPLGFFCNVLRETFTLKVGCEPIRHHCFATEFSIPKCIDTISRMS